MDNNIFSAADAAIAKAHGSKDPEVVADYNNILIGSPLSGTIVGMAMRFAHLGSVAVNGRLDEVWRPFALWHELAHIFQKHVDDPSFNYHRDGSLFSEPVDSRTIPRQELEANLISAEYNIDSGPILEMISYNSRAMQDYRRLKRNQKQLVHAYDTLRLSASGQQPTDMVKYRMAEYRRLLRELEEKRRDLEADLSAMHCVKSIPEIAGEIGTSEVIIKYKLEAMRIRGFDIDMQEPEQYSRVFDGVLYKEVVPS